MWEIFTVEGDYINMRPSAHMIASIRDRGSRQEVDTMYSESKYSVWLCIEY